MSAPERVVPLAVMEDEARRLGFVLTKRDMKFLLLGYSVGRQSDKLFDEEHLRFVTQMILPDHTPNGNPQAGPDATKEDEP